MLLDEMVDRGLSDETRMMKDVTRKFANEHVIPFVRKNWQAEWNMDPDARLPRKILEVADEIGIRTLGVPEEFGGTPLDPKTETQTFAVMPDPFMVTPCLAIMSSIILRCSGGMAAMRAWAWAMACSILPSGQCICDLYSHRPGFIVGPASTGRASAARQDASSR